MKISEVKTCFKIMEAKLKKNNSIEFIYVKKLEDENKKELDAKILTKNLPRVYIIAVNDEIYKIGASEAKGGMKQTLSIYRDGGVKGRPSIRSYGIHVFIMQELKKKNKVEFYMIYLDSIETTIKGLFTEEIVSNVNISAKYLEDKCLLDYRKFNSDKYPL